MEYLRAAAALVVTMGLLVLLHELGHFAMARVLGVRVDRFSIGFGRVLLRRPGRDGVEYALRMLPVGGYVEFGNARGPTEYEGQKAWRKMAIVLAGPAANILVALVLFWASLVLGVPSTLPIVGKPAAGSSAARAGLADGDLVQRVNGEWVSNWMALNEALLAGAVGGAPIQLEVSAFKGGGTARSVTLALDGVRVAPALFLKDLGVMPYQVPLEARLDKVLPGSAADTAGFTPGDLLVSREGVSIQDWREWFAWVRANPGARPIVVVERGGQLLQLRPVIASERRQDGSFRGSFGATIKRQDIAAMGLVTGGGLHPIEAVSAAAQKLVRTTSLMGEMFGKLFTGAVSVENISGPVQIAEVAGGTVAKGAATYLSFLALVSLSIGLMNLLPIHMLDGGQLLRHAIEGVIARPLRGLGLKALHWSGVLMLSLLVGIAITNDLSRLFALG